MSMFSDREIREAAEQDAKDQLRKIGLGHLSVRVTGIANGKARLDIEGGTPDEYRRAFALFGETYEEGGDMETTLG